MEMGSYVSLMAKNHVFLANPLSGTHLHLYFDDENNSDARNNDFFRSAVPLW